MIPLMRDKELYRHLLGLTSPWRVDRVELNVEEKRVDVWATHRYLKSWPCPECERPCGLAGHAEERSWRHLDSCDFETHLHARQPRVRCPEHGVRRVKLPWAEPHSRFTLLFERLAIDLLHETSVKGAAKILRIDWSAAHRIMKRAVERGLAARGDLDVALLGVDEKSVAKGQQYFTLVYDLVHKRVLHVADERTCESLESFFGGLEAYELSTFEAIACDMWQAFVTVASECMPGGPESIVFDRFHIMKHMNEAVDKVRRDENKALRMAGDDRLKGTKNMWRYGKEKLPAKYLPDFEPLRESKLKTARAWALKELLRELWDAASETEANEHWERWYSWAIRSRLEPVKRVARMLKKHLTGVLAYFRHPITNAFSEAINSTVQDIKKRARGYRNREHFKTAIMFRCGGLDLHHPALQTG